MAKKFSADNAVKIIKSLNNANVESIENLLEKLYSRINPLWENFTDKEKDKILGEVKKLWSNLLNNGQDEWLKKLTSLWNKLSYNKKNIILGPLSMLWGTLINNGDKVKLWNRLSTVQKAELLEIFSRKYTMAHAVFAARIITKKNAKELSEIHIEIGEPSNIQNNNQPSSDVVGGTVVIENEKKLYITINYLNSVGIGLDYVKGFISEDCWRFVVSHEIAHIVLHDYKNEYICTFTHSKRKDNDIEEAEADLLAKLLSDLRDRHILENYGDEKDKINSIGKQYAIVHSYKKEIKREEIENKALELDKTSESFTLSNSIFAIREIIGIYESQNSSYNTLINNNNNLITAAKNKKSSFENILIYPDNDIDVDETCVKYAMNPKRFIIVSIAKGIKKIANDIALILGELSLYHEKFTNNKKYIKKQDFDQNEWDEIRKFAKALLAARKNNLETALSKIRKGSRDRIFELKRI